MITSDQFDALVKGIKEVGLGDSIRNNPTNLLIRGIFGAGVEKIFEVMPDGAWPDIFEVEDPPAAQKRASSGYIMVFRKDGATKARGRTPAAKVEDSAKTDG